MSKPAGPADPLVGDLRRAGLLSLLVLHYAAREPTYGNRLIERIEALTEGALRVNPNTMYPLLRSLEAQGLLAGRWEDPDRRSRRFYRATSAGRAECRRLAAELAPRLDRIARAIGALRAEVLDPA
jgi:PadR family transcriptional regulator PadR